MVGVIATTTAKAGGDDPPKNRWTYYDNGAWQDYGVETSTVTVPVATDPNYYWYNNQWWYLSGNRWVYYDHDHWHDGAREMGPKRPWVKITASCIRMSTARTSACRKG